MSRARPGSPLPQALDLLKQAGALLRQAASLPRLLSFAIGAALLVLLLRQVDFSALGRLIFTARADLLLLGLGLYALKSNARALRFWTLLDRPRPVFFAALRFTLANSIAGMLLPFKLGEVVYIYLARREMKASISQGISTLMALRVFDMLATALLFLLAALLLGLPAGFAAYETAILALAGVMVAGLLAFSLALRWLPLLGARLSKPRLGGEGAPPGRVERALRAALRQAVKLLATFRAIGPAQITAGFALSLIEWLLNLGVYHAMLHAIGVNPRPFDTAAAVTFAILASVLPVNTVGSFGTQEAGWAAALLLLGYAQDVAINSGFATHLLQLGYTMSLGGLAWLSYLLAPGERISPPRSAP